MRPADEVEARDGQWRTLIQDRAAPVVLRGLVSDWPAVAQARRSGQALREYLRERDRGARVTVWRAAPAVAGRYGYNDDLTGFNFESTLERMEAVLADLGRFESGAATGSLYVGSTSVEACFDGFCAANPVPHLPDDALASIWLGSPSVVAAHHDLPDNLACVVAGRRRFTLFPPEAAGDLYLGPPDFNPAGQAISLVDFAEPDFARFPRFRHALECAQVAELGPGDALYVPGLWWHHVVATAAFNVLVNYWWRTWPAWQGSAQGAFLHALLAIHGLSARERAAWQALFAQFVFSAPPESSEHLPGHARGALGPLDETGARRVRAMILNLLNR